MIFCPVVQKLKYEQQPSLDTSHLSLLPPAVHPVERVGDPHTCVDIRVSYSATPFCMYECTPHGEKRPTKAINQGSAGAAFSSPHSVSHCPRRRIGWLAISRCLADRAERRAETQAIAAAAAALQPRDAGGGAEAPIPQGQGGAPPGGAAGSSSVAGAPPAAGHGHVVSREEPPCVSRPESISSRGMSGRGSSQAAAEGQVVVVIAPEISSNQRG